jgi:hypothetical protein
MREGVFFLACRKLMTEVYYNLNMEGRDLVWSLKLSDCIETKIDLHKLRGKLLNPIRI